jgi:nucleoside-diphosphate-sugar epimerase
MSDVVTVFGGTGFLGRRIVHALLARGAIIVSPPAIPTLPRSPRPPTACSASFVASDGVLP